RALTPCSLSDLFQLLDPCRLVILCVGQLLQRDDEGGTLLFIEADRRVDAVFLDQKFLVTASVVAAALQWLQQSFALRDDVNALQVALARGQFNAERLRRRCLLIEIEIGDDTGMKRMKTRSRQHRADRTTGSEPV